MKSVLALVENKDIDLADTEIYAAIIGASPSKGAKSPSLWNAAFKALSISGVMHPMDVKPENLGALIAALKNDQRFIGSAVAVPYKIDVVPFLDQIEPEAKAIGAVNCIYRKGDKLVGSNTDGAGALWSLEKEIGDLKGRTVLLIGGGGAALAVAAYITTGLSDSGRLILSNRKRIKAEKMAMLLKENTSVSVIHWPPSLSTATDVDVLINCTSVGYEAIQSDEKGLYCNGFFTPLASAGDDIRVSGTEDAEKGFADKAAEEIAHNIAASLKFLACMKKAMVFDIVYQPTHTILLNLARLVGHKILNGVGMNLEQAVIAFDKATATAGLREPAADQVRKIMAEVW